MASGVRKAVLSPPVYSNVHPGRLCQECCLCKERKAVYTHASKWKNKSLFEFLRKLVPVEADSCICHNCRDSAARGERDPTNFHPRWAQLSNEDNIMLCEVPECGEHARRSTKMGSAGNQSGASNLCAVHYRALHKATNPGAYKSNCTICSCAISAPRYRTVADHANVHQTISTSIQTCPLGTSYA